MTMASVAVTQGSPGNSSAMITPKRYQLQSAANNANNSHSQSSNSSNSPKNYDTISKGKKSWSVRLGLSRQSNISPNDVPKQGWGTISGGSALSRQMRYGDPWLYGTVRAGNRKNIIQDPRSSSSSLSSASNSCFSASNGNNSSVQQLAYNNLHRQSNTATQILVVCSCPEFLSGTTRRLGNCKKCGGHRLAGIPLGGTCRVPQTSSRLRPSLAGVLRPPLDDPYDLVRRSRLVEPRSRARSISPHRQGITNNRQDARSQSVAILISNHQRSSSEWFNGKKNNEWIEQGINRNDHLLNDDDNDDVQNNRFVNRRNNSERKTINVLQRDIDPRKSILECDVNPYLLVKKQQRDKNEEVDDVEEEDDDFSDDLSDNALELDDHLPTLFDPSKVKSIDRLPARCSSVAAIGGQRIRVFNEPREILSDNDDNDDNDVVESDNNDKRKFGRKCDNVNDDDYRSHTVENDFKMINLPHPNTVAPTTSIPIPKVSPKRPPRKQKVDAKITPVKSILKRLKANNNNSYIKNNNSGKKKSVLFNVDNVIFAPAKFNEFNLTTSSNGRHIMGKISASSSSSAISNNSHSSSSNDTDGGFDDLKPEDEDVGEVKRRKEEDEDENEEATIVLNEKIRNQRPKFITIPNIKDLKPKEKSLYNSNKIKGPSNTKNDKFTSTAAVVPACASAAGSSLMRSSGIPKVINNVKPSTANINENNTREKNVKQVEFAVEKVIACSNESEVKPGDEIGLETDIEEPNKEEMVKNTTDQPAAENNDPVKRHALQRSQSERIPSNVDIVENVPFTDTMRLSVRKRQRNANNVVSMHSTDPINEEEINKEVLADGCKISDTYKESTSSLMETSTESRVSSLNSDKTMSSDHFRRMRPTSWSPPPMKHKNLPQNRSSDPGTIDFKPPISQSSNIKTSSAITSNKSENVFKITLSPLQSPLVHRLQIGSSEISSRGGVGETGGGEAGGSGRRTSIMINGDQNLNSETSFDNKVTISVGGEDSVCNPTVISVNSDISPKIKSSSENRTLVILDNYSSNIIVEPSKEERMLRNYSDESDDSLTRIDKLGKRFLIKDEDNVQLRKADDNDSKNCNLSKEAVVSKLLEDSLKKARRNGEILDESSGEAILKILKQTLLKSANAADYESSDSTVEPDKNYSRSSSLNSEVDFVQGNIYIEENPYEVIKEPIYEEIPDEPPPLPLSPPPSENYNKDQIYFGDEYKEANYYKKFNTPGKFLTSYFPDDFFKKPNPEELSSVDEQFSKTKSPTSENYSSKFELLNYLIDSKDRTSLVEEEVEEDEDEEDAEGELEALYEQKETSLDDLSSKSSQISNVSDSSEEGNIALATSGSPETLKMRTVDIERTDSGVGSESSQASSSRGAVRRWRGNNVASSSGPGSILAGMPQVVSGDVKLCHDCEQRLDPLVTISGVVYAPFVCRKCAKKRSERKEIIMEIVETEQKYGRDLQIILEEFHRPMLRAGLLTQDQLSAIFLNVEELLEHNVILAEKLRDAVDFAQEAGDEDLVTMDVGKIFLESEGMLHAFESYCTRQGGASLLLQNLEKEKELLRIFLKVSQMENTVLRRMNLNSFLMVPVQRVTKYPLLLARLFKATPSVRPDIQIAKNKLKQAQTNIELHLEHMNAEAKDVTSTKLWRRISIIQNGRRSMGEQDMVNIKLRKMAVEVLEWAHEEVRFALEGRLLVASPTDNNWRRGKTVKLVPVTAMLVTNGKPNTQFLDLADDSLFPRQIGIKEATLLLVKEKIGRYSLLREPLHLDKCIVCCEADLEDYFEIQELSSKETFIFKAEDGVRTKRWCRTLQAHAQSLGAWRRRRGALANIMICGVARN